MLAAGASRATLARVNRPRTTNTPRVRLLTGDDLADVTGGSLNTYISKVQGEKQYPPPPPPTK
jgi:hypothetical protein